MNSKMESVLGSLFISMIIFLASTTAIVEASVEFKVGNDFGWQVPSPNNSAFYSQWASINRFQVGDSLSFEYKNDSVYVVEKWDYYHCNTSEAIASFNNGKSAIQLDRPGPFYFISGVPDHCKNGQRLLVEVMHPISMSPPTIASPPEPYFTIAPSPSKSAGVSVSVTFGSVCMAIILASLGTSGLATP